MSVWSHIILEAYCFYNCSKNKYVKYYEIVDLKNLETLDFKKCKREKNTLYNPEHKRPNWCVKQNKKNIPQYRCLYGCKEKCPFLGLVNADKSDYKFLNKKY